MSQLNNKKWTSKRMENNKEKDGKKENTNKNNKYEKNKKFNKNDRNDRNNRNNKFDRNNRNNKFDRNNRNKTITVKMTNLPNDITVKELNELILPWGHIGNINFGKSSFKIAYIDFYKRDEAEYFVKALDRTPFDQLIIGVEIA